MTRPILRITAYGEAVLTFPFHRGLVEALKTEIPGYARTYDPVTKAWTVDTAYLTIARELLTTVYPDTEIIDDAPHFESSNDGPHFDVPQTSHTVLHLLPSAPPELVESAYRTLARLNHPDHGGDTDTMQQLNNAISAIRRGTPR